MPGDATILDYARTCMVLFDTLLSSLNGTSRPDPDAELSAQADDQSGRFSIWAGNIGVFATANASLDYRVRGTPQIKDLIIQQLDGLAKFLQRSMCPIVSIEESLHSRLTDRTTRADFNQFSYRHCST